MHRLTSFKKAINVLPLGIAVLGFLLTYIAYAPGVMTPDAMYQFYQAQTGHFTDIHPPIMAWIWSKTNIIIPGTEGFFLLLATLYWIGFLLLIRNIMKRSLVRAIIASILPFSPIFFSFSGTIWKDVLVFGCLLVATGMVLGHPAEASKRFPVLPSLVVLALWLLACLARWNSFPGVVPLVVLAFWPQPPMRAPLRRTFYRLVLCLPVVLLTWAASGELLQVTVVHAKRTGFANMLPLWDLVGMSHRLDRNLLPGHWSKQQSYKIIHSCYDPRDDNNLGMPSPCFYIHQDLVNNGYWNLTTLFPLWADTIVKHPLAYFEMRLGYVHTLFWPNAIFMFDADNRRNTFNDHSGLLFETEKQLMEFLKTAPALQYLFTVGFWMLVTALLTPIFAVGLARGRQDHYASFLLSLSGGATLWPLVVIGPDGQFRFAYWAIVAVCIALLIAGGREMANPVFSTSSVSTNCIEGESNAKDQRQTATSAGSYL